MEHNCYRENNGFDVGLQPASAAAWLVDHAYHQPEAQRLN
jgi:hypothetical protein